MKYSTIKFTQLIFGAVLTCLWIIMLNFFGDHGSAPWVVTAIICVIICAGPLIYLDRLENRLYPQWENLWRVPVPMIVMMVVLLAIMVVAAFVSEQSQTWIIVPILFARCIIEYYYSRKYHMDEVHSLEELLAANPEARENLRKIVLGG